MSGRRNRKPYVEGQVTEDIRKKFDDYIEAEGICMSQGVAKILKIFFEGQSSSPSGDDHVGRPVGAPPRRPLHEVLRPLGASVASLMSQGVLKEVNRQSSETTDMAEQIQAMSIQVSSLVDLCSSLAQQQQEQQQQQQLSIKQLTEAQIASAEQSRPEPSRNPYVETEQDGSQDTFKISNPIFTPSELQEPELTVLMPDVVPESDSHVILMADPPFGTHSAVFSTVSVFNRPSYMTLKITIKNTKSSRQSLSQDGIQIVLEREVSKSSQGLSSDRNRRTRRSEEQRLSFFNDTDKNLLPLKLRQKEEQPVAVEVDSE